MKSEKKGFSCQILTFYDGLSLRIHVSYCIQLFPVVHYSSGSLDQFLYTIAYSYTLLNSNPSVMGITNWNYNELL